jgi:hypothetical protein
MSIRFVRVCRALAVSLSLVAAAGCSKDRSPPATGEAPPASKTSAADRAGGHAPAGVKPGSHEDWCGEHAVPESQCTRCNPALIPAFKATSDWCEEHGLPESQCLICNPEIKIERPPKGS